MMLSLLCFVVFIQGKVFEEVFGEAFEHGGEAARFFLSDFAQEFDLQLQESVCSQRKRQSLLVEVLKSADCPAHLFNAQLLELFGVVAVAVNDL